MKKLLLLVLVSFAFLSCNKVKVDKYVASFTQSGENAPDVKVFENTIGNIEWEYISAGVYYGNFEDEVDVSNIFFVLNNGVDGNISCDLRIWNGNFVELRTFAGFDEHGSPKPSNGCGGIGFEIRSYD